MRRIVVALAGTVSGLIMLFSYHTSLGGAGTFAAAVPAVTGTSRTTEAAPSTAGGTTSSGTTSGGTTSGGATSGGAASTVTGAAVQTRWGPVQVQITVASGSITDVAAVQHPTGNSRDQQINDYALPVLAQEAMAAQGARIDHVSGATVTSDGYVQSLQSALDRAHL